MTRSNGSPSHTDSSKESSELRIDDLPVKDRGPEQIDALRGAVAASGSGLPTLVVADLFTSIVRDRE